MGIWIRSQDKRELIYTDNLYIKEKLKTVLTEYGAKNAIEGYAIWQNCHEKYFNLGLYSTEEKALKVLDMIQEFIKNNENVFGRVSDFESWYGQIVTHDNNVFQMPQDSEVIV